MELTKNPFCGYIKLSHSYKVAPDMRHTGTSDADEIIEVTIRIRRKKSIEEAIQNNSRFTHEAYEQEYGASDEDINIISSFAHYNDLTIAACNKARRSVILKGRVHNFEKAFQVYISTYLDVNGSVFRGRTGHIHVPEELAAIVEGVFGLDNRPHVKPRFRVAGTNKKDRVVSHTATRGYRPGEIARAYGFPENVTGKGQCIGIIELGGGYRSNDLQTYFTGLGLAVPAVTAISVDSGHNYPTVADSADGEVMLDIEVAGAIASGAKIAVYFATNTDKGFLDAITQAIHDTQNKPTVISISWGSAEITWTQQSLNSYNEAFKAASLLGITICVASGDSGSSDGLEDGQVHVDFPASSPYVLACGGTKLVTANNKIVSETVWHEADGSASGGGISNFFPLPDYQQQAGVPLSLDTHFKGRGVPDVAGNADADTGYQVLVDGEELVIGGTSAVAPLFAGLIALLNEQKGKQVGFINPQIYADPKVCRDIVQGNNTTTTTGLGYTAGKGWDACTGLGVLSAF